MQRYAADEYSFQAKMIGSTPETTVLRFLTKSEAARATLNPDQNRMLDILREFGEGASVDQWRGAVIEAKLWTITRGKNKGEQPSNPRQKWADELGKLVKGGWVEIINGTMVELNDELVRPAEPDAGEEFGEDDE